MTPEELADLAHLRRARDRIDRDHAEPLDVPAMARTALMSPTVGAPGQSLDIALFQPDGGRSQTEGDALLTLVTQGSLQAAIFRTDDLDATFERVRASGRRRSRGAHATARSATRRATS